MLFHVLAVQTWTAPFANITRWARASLVLFVRLTRGRHYSNYVVIAEEERCADRDAVWALYRPRSDDNENEEKRREALQYRFLRRAYEEWSRFGAQVPHF